MRKLLSLFLLCVIAISALLPRLCECAYSETSVKQQDMLDLRTAADEFCDDCGHTRTCCFSKPQVPGGLITNVENALWASNFSVLVAWISTFDFTDKSPPEHLVGLSVPPAIAKWPCSKSYLAKQSLLI